MKRITKGDIKFQLDPRLIYIDDFTIKFYTVNKDYCLTRNQSNVDVEGESGDTKYYIDLDWSELQIIGEGVLQYIATNNIEDVHFLDHEYNKTVERSTQYFINSGIYIDEEEEETIADLVDELNTKLEEEIVRSTEFDAEIAVVCENLGIRIDENEDVTSAALNDLNQRILVLDDEVSGITENKLDESAFTEYSAATEALINTKVDNDVYTAFTAATSEAINAESTARENADNAISGVVDTKLYESAFTAYSSATESVINSKLDNSAFAQYSAATKELIDAKVENTAFTEYSAATETALGNKLEISAFTSYSASVDSTLASKADTTAMTQAIEAATSGKVDTTAFTSYSAETQQVIDTKFGAVAYDSNSKRINFYSKSNLGAVLAYVDATDFIKDGMVSNVEIKDVEISGETVTCLVITFNSDSGKEAINIPISDIFNANNYYTKSEVDTNISAATSGKVDTSVYTAYTSATDTVLSSKADTTAMTQAIEAATSGKVDTSVYTAYTSATESVLSSKASNTDLQAVSGQVSTNTTNIGTISGDVATKASNTDLQAVSGQVSANTTNIGTISGDVATKASNTDLQAVSGQVSTNTTNIELVTLETLANKTALGGCRIVKISQSDYDNLPYYDPNTIYFIY